MAEEQLLERLTREIRQRLEEIRPLVEEQRALERALEQLEGIETDGEKRPAPAPEAPPPPARPAAQPPSGGGRRAGRGQRREELLQLVKGAPISIGEAARQMGIAPSQASTLARKLTEEGLLTRHEGRLVLVAEAASQAPPAPQPPPAGDDPPAEGYGSPAAERPAPPPVVAAPAEEEAPQPPPVVPVPPRSAPPAAEPPFPDWSEAGSGDPVRRTAPASPPRPLPPERPEG